jgi:hypothetical protein
VEHFVVGHRGGVGDVDDDLAVSLPPKPSATV